ncbi:MAG TPA: class I SAM-dependent methyltransferase [Polyangia bacterium]|jgi:SAM-dependent methyltransferase|nr:class I SAM-dependent methyltransferase [Polyangia bacterium]
MTGACPLCEATAFDPLHARVRDFEHGLPNEVDFVVCRGCGLVVQDPQPALAALLSFYPDDYRPHVSGTAAAGGGGVLGRLKALQSRLLVSRYARWLPADRAESIADVGCGSGQFLRALAAAGYTDLTGVDRNPRLAEGFAGTPIRFLARELEPDFDLGGRYQTIVMNYVLEHFLDPLRVLGGCRAALAPGGRLVIMTPNVDAWAHRLWGRTWSGLHAPRHTHLFNPQTLKRAAEKAGFTRVETAFVTDPASWAFSFQNRVRSRAPAASAVARGTAWYALASLPLWAPFALAERLAGRGGSIVMVAAAPA